MRFAFIQLLLFAAFAAVGAPGVAAQTRPDLWEISVEAAAAAGPDSPVAPVILGNTLALAEERDPMAPALSSHVSNSCSPRSPKTSSICLRESTVRPTSRAMFRNSILSSIMFH